MPSSRGSSPSRNQTPAFLRSPALASRFFNTIATYTHTHTHTHVMEYFSTIKKNEFLPFATMCMDLEGILLGELSDRER